MSDYNCSYALGNEISFQVYILITLFLAAVSIGLLLKNYRNALTYLGSLLILIGGAHNLYQRIRYSCVIDTMDFFGFFVFNISDILITLGVILSIMGVLLYGKKESTDH